MASAKLTSLIAKREGKKSQASIGNVRETVKSLEFVIAQDAFDNDYPIDSSPLFVSLYDAISKQVAVLRKKARA